MALVAAIFRDMKGAEEAVERLIEHGFAAEDIALVAVSSGAPLVAATGFTTTEVGNEVQRRYAKHLSPGQVLLIVHGHELVDEARQLLRDAGAHSLRPEARYRAGTLTEEDFERLGPAHSFDSESTPPRKRRSRKAA
jgi:hypothetical protein